MGFVCKSKPRARIEKKWTNIIVDDDQPLQSDDIEGDEVLGASINIVPTTQYDPADIHEGSLDGTEEDFEREPYVKEGSRTSSLCSTLNLLSASSPARLWLVSSSSLLHLHQYTQQTIIISSPALLCRISRRPIVRLVAGRFSLIRG